MREFSAGAVEYPGYSENGDDWMPLHECDAHDWRCVPRLRPGYLAELLLSCLRTIWLSGPTHARRHPSAAISSLVPSVSCRRCSPNAPFAKLEMLTAERL